MKWGSYKRFPKFPSQKKPPRRIHLVQDAGIALERPILPPEKDRTVQSKRKYNEKKRLHDKHSTA